MEDSDLVFPQDDPNGLPGHARKGGLTRRDYFAGRAPTIPVQGMTKESVAEQLADWAYIFADAMLERSKR